MARAYWNRSITMMFASILGIMSSEARALDTFDTRLLHSPAITEGRIAFVYGDDIWVAGLDGLNPKRLTSHPGAEESPHFSPDGRKLAFSASYDGNVDVYVIPAEGGEPTRLSWHPGDDVVRGFTPQGKVLFSSPREVFSRRHTQFFVVASRRRRSGAIAGADGRQGLAFAGREVSGLHSAERVFPAMEELSWRNRVAHLDSQTRRPFVRRDSQARRRVQRHRADVDR